MTAASETDSAQPDPGGERRSESLSTLSRITISRKNWSSMYNLSSRTQLPITIAFTSILNIEKDGMTNVRTHIHIIFYSLLYRYRYGAFLHLASAIGSIPYARNTNLLFSSSFFYHFFSFFFSFIFYFSPLYKVPVFAALVLKF